MMIGALGCSLNLATCPRFQSEIPTEGILQVKYAAIGPISLHFPETVETNEQLAAENPSWDMELIGSKTGIYSRHIAAEDECSSDLGVAAAKKLFTAHNIDPHSVDFLLFCTQTPDYPLPTTACLMQSRLGLKTAVGAFDFNLGCSGFVYGISIADALIRGGMAKRVLLITAETYTKFIDPTDRSLRTIFGDGAAATLIDAADEPSLSSFEFGTDGEGADTLIVNTGGCRPSAGAIQPRKRKRWPSKLYMDGPSLIQFTVGAVPKLVDKIIENEGIERDAIDYFILHQATFKMLEMLREKLQLSRERLPLALANYGNTTSSTIPILIQQMRTEGQLNAGIRSMLVGFGVGFSWAGCMWQETYSAT